ncbi:MAG TPA: choice-of-anchor D domain-containing protein [Candidatus Acidoferrum sp.]|nr:choice-of-anchor D domain-containing protein [Candidatus Acidoferrum sp.]
MLRKLFFLITLLTLVAPFASAQALGTIKTIAGGVPNNVQALSVGIGTPTAVFKDSGGNLYVAADSTAGFNGGLVFKIDSTGNLTTVAGNNSYSYVFSLVNNGDGGPAVNASLGPITGLFVDAHQNTYITDSYLGTVRKINSSGIISTVAGGGSGCTGQADPYGDGCPATSAILSAPQQLFVDANLNIFIADSGSALIREVVASSGVIQTVAGGGTVCAGASDTVGDGCSATSATLFSPAGVFLDSHGNIFISDSGNSRIREVSVATGIISTVAGTGSAGDSGDGAAATSAQIDSPQGLFVDGAGDVFFADGGSSLVREVVASTGFMQTVAGGGLAGCPAETDTYGDGCPANEAFLVSPISVYVDSSNNLYIADQSAYRVRQVLSSGGVLSSSDIIQAVAGNGSISYGGDGLLAINAQIGLPYGVAVDSSDNVYIADLENQRVRKVNGVTGIISTVAGSGTFQGCTAETDVYGDGCLATQAFVDPIQVFVDGTGNLFISDLLGEIREVSAATDIITAVAGGGAGCPNQTDAIGDGCPATSAIITDPWGLYVDIHGNIFFSDYGHEVIREVVASTGLIKTIAGTGTSGYNGDNIPAIQAQISLPTGLYADPFGNVYFSDTENYRVREIVASTGNIITVAGTGTPGYNGDNIAANIAEIGFPYGIFVDHSGNIFFGDQINNRVREVVASTGLIQSVAGNGVLGFSGDGGSANSAELAYPESVATDSNGNLFIADTYNNRIREVFGAVPGNTLAISTLSLPNATVGSAYSFGLQAVGGVPPYTWTIASGALPSDFSPLSSTGVISGTPGAADANTAFAFTVKVTDSANNTQTESLLLTVNPAVASTASANIQPTSLPFGSQIVSTTSPAQAITITSNGTLPFLISSIAITGTNAGDFLQSTNCPISPTDLAPGNSCGIFVTFTPTDIGARTANVVITDNQGSVPGSQQSVPLTGTGADVPVAASTTYSISTNPFTSFTGSVSCPPDCNLTGYFTVPQPLAPNLNNVTVSSTNWSANVGPYVFNKANTTGANFASISTDASGSIIGWSITLATSNYSVTTNNVPGNVADTFTVVSPAGTASNSNSPVTWPKITVTPLSFPISATPVSGVATLNCPSGTVPCTDPNAHSLKLAISAVNTPFTLTVTSFEVPPSQANGVCEAGHTEATDFDCRFVSNFALKTDGAGNVTVPLCIPYSNGNCVFYRVSNTPPATAYAPGVTETIAWNNESFTPPAFYNANNPRLFDDPDAPPYDVNHQFVFDITDYISGGSGQVGVDLALHGHTAQYNDFVAAYPAATTGTYLATILSPVGTPAFIAGANVPVNFSLTLNGTFTGTAITAPNAVSVGVINSTGVRQPVLTTGGVAPVFIYNTSVTPPQYQLMFSTTGYAPGVYTLFISSNLFPQQAQNFIVNPVPLATLLSISVTPATPTLATGTTQQFVATGNYSDGSVQNLTGSVTWTSDTPSVATVSVSGLVTAHAAGKATIEANTGTVAGATLLTVNSHLYAYIGSGVSATCCLDVYDTSTNQLVKSIPVTTIAEPIGITPDQTRLYLSDFNNNIVDVVDTTSNTLVSSFPIPGGPNAAAISPNGRFGYVANANNNTVSVFDVSTNAIVATIPVSFSPGWVSVTPDSSLVYVTGSSNTVAVISAATNTVASIFNVAPPTGQPITQCLGGPTINSSGTLAYFLQLCVGQTVPGSVTVISIPSNTLVATIPAGLTPYDAALTPDGSLLYVVNARGNNVSVINTTTNQVIATVPVGTGPQSVATTPDGATVYIANTVGNTVSTIQTSTNTVSSTFAVTTPFGIVIASPPPASQATTLTLNPSNLIFNTQVIGITSAGQTIIVTNPGTSPVTLSNVALTGPNAAQFSLINSCPQPPAALAGGATCPIEAFFTPFAAGAQTALITITSTNGLASSQQSAPLSGVGTGSGATIQPSSLDLGSQIVSTPSAPGAVTITSTGDAPFVISNIGLSGTNAGDFSQSTNCPIGGTGLAPGNSCGIFVSVTPSELGVRTANLVITDNQGNLAGAQQTVPLTGTGTDVPVLPLTIYGFRGSPFTAFTGSVSCPPDCYIGGDFALLQPLAPNLSNASVSPVSFNLVVGTANLSLSNVTSSQFLVSTDSFGNLMAWSISAANASFSISTKNVPGNVADSFQVVSPQGSASNSNSPAVQAKTTITPLSFPVSSTPVSGVATMNCPSGTTPCTDPNAHSLKLVVPAVSTAFTLTVTAFEVPASTANGVCEAGHTEATDFDCRFVTNFALKTDGAGNVTVPLCVPYSNGNCVFYRVSNTPPASYYTAGVQETIAWNNESFTPPAFYNASNPRLYDDPDAPPYDVNHQFVFDITDFQSAGVGQVGVDLALHGHTSQYNDFVAAYPAAPTGTYVATILSPVGTPSFTAGANVPVNFSLTLNGTFTGVAITPPNAVSVGVVNSNGVRQSVLTTGGVAPVFTYNAAATPPQYQLVFSTTGYAPGTYTLFINSNLFPQQAQSFTITTSATLQSIAVTPANPSILSNATLQFTATGTYSDESTQNLTSSVIWTSTSTNTAGISSSGFATAANPGTTTIVATLGNIIGQTQLTVTQAPPPTATIGINPSSLSFGSQTVSTTSSQHAITISSIGTAPLLISSIALSGANSGDFQQASNCPIGGAGLAPGNSCGIFVTFAPTALGARTASVVITDNQGNVSGSQQSIPLTGTGADVAPVASTTYNITGNPFTSFTGGVSCSPYCNVLGSFTLAQPLAPNLSNATILPTSFSFSVGTSNLTQSNATSSSFGSISTDASGNITSWSISLSNANFSILTENLPGVAQEDFYQQTSPQGTASNTNSPATWPKTVVTPVTFPVSSTPVSGVATLNCPSGTVPCTDPNAHSLKLVVPAVSTGFTLTVTAVEVPASQANGICEAGHTEATDFDCRFVANFALKTDGAGNVTVPLCVPYSNGNCVFYRVSNTPPGSDYTAGVQETIAWNNESFTPPAFYNASNPRLFDDPDAPPYNVNHQFVFDITDFQSAGAGQVGVDLALHGHTSQYNDFVAAYPAAPVGTYVATVIAPVNNPSFAAGSDIPVAFSLTHNGTFTGVAITPPNAVSVGVVNSNGVRQSVLTTGGVAPVFTYNAAATPPQYQLVFNTTGYAPGTYTLFINSNLFPQLSQTFTISSSAPQAGVGPQPTNPFTITKDGNGNYIVALTLINSGNVTLDSCTLTGGTLGAASLSSVTGGSCALVTPGQPFSFSLAFPGSAGADGASVPLRTQGIYTVGSTSGNWGITIRSAKLP